MITFKKIPVGSLNAKTGEAKGIGTPKPEQKQPANVGIPYESLRDQVIPLAQKGVELEKVLKAVDAHESILDKNKAKSMVQAMYTILSSKKPKNKV